MTTATKSSESKFAQLAELLSRQEGIAGGVSASAVEDSERALGLHYPPTYRWFLQQFGTIANPTLTIFGLGVSRAMLPSVECAIAVLRAWHPELPPPVVPFYFLDRGVFACLDALPPGDMCEEPQVIRWDVRQPWDAADRIILAPTFATFVKRQLARPHWRAEALEQLKAHVARTAKELQYDHATGGKLPRNHDWRPYRYCVQDVLFGTTVVRHLRTENCLEVDVFLTADIPSYGPLAGAIALTAFLLSEAYKCGGTMEIRFTDAVEGGQVPEDLEALAARYGIQFANTRRIAPAEAKALFAGLTGFSATMQTRLAQLEQAGAVSQTRACYVVHHGVWSKEQVELLIEGCDFPDSVLGGDALPHQRLLYQHDLLCARAALLAGLLDRCLGQRRRPREDNQATELEDDLLPLEIGFDSESFTRRYTCAEPILLPWVHGQTAEVQIDDGGPFWVLVRARDAADLLMHVDDDVNAASALRTLRERPVFLLVPGDFSALPAPVRETATARAREAGVALLVAPETTDTLDVEAASKLARSRVLRK